MEVTVHFSTKNFDSNQKEMIIEAIFEAGGKDVWFEEETTTAEE